MTSHDISIFWLDSHRSQFFGELFIFRTIPGLCSVNNPRFIKSIEIIFFFGKSPFCFLIFRFSAFFSYKKLLPPAPRRRAPTGPVPPVTFTALGFPVRSLKPSSKFTWRPPAAVKTGWGPRFVCEVGGNQCVRTIVYDTYKLIGDFNPPEKYESQIGSSSQLFGKIIQMFQTTKQFKYVELMFPSLPPLNPSTLIRIPTWQLLLQHQRSVVQVEPAKLGADAGIGGKHGCLHHEELHLAALPIPEL